MHYRHTGVLASQESCTRFLSLSLGSSTGFVIFIGQDHVYSHVLTVPVNTVLVFHLYVPLQAVSL